MPTSEARRLFETKGYEKMIERIMEGPIKSSQAKQNTNLQQKLEDIKSKL